MAKRVDSKDTGPSPTDERAHSGSCACPKCAPEVHGHGVTDGLDGPDKRGVTNALKRRVRGEEAALAALRESYRHPIEVPDELRAKHRLAPSERRPPFEWGTLDWYRNELALAQERIRLLESERDVLLAEKRERDPVMQYVVNGPRAIAELDRRPRGGNQPVDDSGWTKVAAKALAKNPGLRPVEIADAIKGAAPGRSDRYLRKWVRERESDLRAHGQAIAEKLAQHRAPYFQKW